nr:MAG TPA: hypothetical protein [Caudovirales sp. ctNII2]
MVINRRLSHIRRPSIFYSQIKEMTCKRRSRGRCKRIF